MFITLDELKLYLGIDLSNTQYDDLLNMYLEDSRGVIVSEIGDLTQQEHIEQITLCDIEGDEITLPFINITGLLEINNIAYTGIINEDYRILPPQKLRLWVKDWSSYLSGVEKYFDIKVRAGYNPVPADLKLLQKMICGLMWNTKGGKVVKSYKLGPRSFTFADTQETENTILSIGRTISKYSILSPV